MKRFSEKVFLQLKMPTEEAPISDHKRILLALHACGYNHVEIPLPILQQIYPMCRECDYDITVTLVYREKDWVVTAIEPGDQQNEHYGIAVDYGSTTVGQYLDTKAAAHTMIECLLEIVGCQEKNLAHCYLSGAFSAHSNLESAITIGIFPDISEKKYSCIANTSLEGARILLLDRSRLTELHELSENIYCVQFASIPHFLIRMRAAKFIPHTDMIRYPSVENRLNDIQHNK